MATTSRKAAAIKDRETKRRIREEARAHGIHACTLFLTTAQRADLGTMLSSVGWRPWSAEGALAWVRRGERISGGAAAATDPAQLVLFVDDTIVYDEPRIDGDAKSPSVIGGEVVS